MTSITTLIASLGFGTTVAFCGIYGQELARWHQLGLESLPSDSWSGIALVASALATVGFVVKALIAERRSSAAMQAKAALEVAQAKTKADAETVARLRQIEDDRAQLARLIAETLARNTIVMEQHTMMMAQLVKSIDENTRLVAASVARCQAIGREEEPHPASS